MRFLDWPLRDPALNLALEEALFENLPEDSEGIFMLWQNSPAVIIGRHQSAECEVNRPALGQIPLLRRITGGGAVYHDLGNLNFSFIERNPDPLKCSFSGYTAKICASLRMVGITAQPGGRNDIEVKGRKISGSAQLRKDGKILHHGTLLWNLDCAMPARLLTPEKAKLDRHSVGSINSRIINIKNLLAGGLQTLKEALADNCSSGATQVTDEVWQKALCLADHKYRNAAWNWGQTAAGNRNRTLHGPWGKVQIRLGVTGSRVQFCSLAGDFFALQDIGELETRLSGCPISSLPTTLGSLCSKEWIRDLDSSALADLILDVVQHG